MKYFYTDPLAAAWMQSHLEMEFEAGDWEVIHNVSDYGYEYVKMHCSEIKIFIHSDSIYLLEPIVHDIGIDRITTKCFTRSPDCWVEIGTEYFHSEKLEIIQRNGIPFMWPETEE